MFLQNLFGFRVQEEVVYLVYNRVCVVVSLCTGKFMSRCVVGGNL